jgi:guanylate kinase
MMEADKFLARDGSLLVIIGPSGTGKSTIVAQLLADEIIELTPDWTERPKRPGEQGSEHVFVTPEQMDKAAEAGKFLHPPMPFLGLKYRYALPKILRPASGKVPLVLTRAAALPLLDNYYANYKMYQIEAPPARTEKIQAARNKNGEAEGTRWRDFDKEQESGRKFATRVFVNNNFEETIAKITQAIRQDFPRQLRG